jgi:hypothetical protein
MRQLFMQRKRASTRIWKDMGRSRRCVRVTHELIVNISKIGRLDGNFAWGSTMHFRRFQSA